MELKITVKTKNKFKLKLEGSWKKSNLKRMFKAKNYMILGPSTPCEAEIKTPSQKNLKSGILIYFPLLLVYFLK